MKLEELEKNLLASNPDLEKELEADELEYQVIRQILKARKEKNITQAELAKIMHTRQSNISRLESENYNPSVKLLNH